MRSALDRFNETVARYRNRGVLLDANLLVLYVVGSHDARLIQATKATRSFERRDFEFIARLVAYAGRLVTTPHLLTEVNGLSNTGVPRRLRRDYLTTFRKQIGSMVEVHTEAAAIAEDEVFLRLGLTDAAVLSLGGDPPLVVSTDLDLCVALDSRRLAVVNYNHVRFLF
ncbi:MAG: hypothetical protein AAF594_06270 [Bacteroidota bacterium]